jgi:hypothetical protein
VGDEATELAEAKVAEVAADEAASSEKHPAREIRAFGM